MQLPPSSKRPRVENNGLSAPVPESHHDNYREGQLVAVLTERLEDSPWLGKIKEVKLDGTGSLRIVWLEGTYSSKWRAAKIKKGRKMVDWEDTIKAETVILSRFSLGKDNRLAKETVKLLKELYISYF